MSDISAELAATCAALGYYDGIKYHLDTHCLDVIKDLIKYLKRDDDSHTVRHYLGQAKLLETDLKKILIQHSDKVELWDVLLRLLINLTSSALMVYNEVVPTEKTHRNMYQQLVVYLQQYKVALADDKVWSVVGQRLQKILNMESAERGEDNEMVIERILTLIRNILQVPPNDNEKRADNDATIHDEVLFALHTSGLVDMLLFMASNMSEQQYHMQVLEIVAFMLREQCPTRLANVGLERNIQEKEKESAKLLAIREKQAREKMEKMKKYAGSRHSRFGGTYVVENMKAIGDNQLICHKPYQKIEALQFGLEKVKMKRGKAKIPLVDPIEVRTSALSVRLFLKEFCVEFMNGAYNPVMRYARSCINNGVSSDASHYLWTLRFFMEFNRRYKFQIKYVSETISTEIFHLVQSQLVQYYEMMMTDKKKIPMWSAKLQLAMKAYQELLLSLAAMDTAEDEGVRESSKIIKCNVFYVPEYRETILSQLINYDSQKMSRTYLVDLVTTAHVFLKMLKQFCNQSRTVIVRKKAVKRSRAGNKKKKSNAKQAPQSELSVTSLNDQWDDVAPEISAVMREGTIPQVVPFDATLETPIDEQKSDAMKRIQKLLRKKEFEQAVGLLRAAREVWPENDCFGKPDIPVEEEFLALRDIFFAELGVDIDPANVPQDDDIEETEQDEYNEEDEDESGEVAFEETSFNFEEFLRRFANVKVVKAVAMLLAHFEENTDEVNHYIVKMLHRIAWDCKMPGMIFQASIFRIFQKILESQSKKHKDLKKFAIFIINRFAQVAAENKKAYMELLFWKTTREATEMVDGYDAVSTNEKISRALWTEAEEDELRVLFMEHQTKKYTQDLIDWILENIISDNRTRRGIIKKLKEMSLIVNSKTVRSEVQKRLPAAWSEEEIAQLTEIWHRVREDDDPIDEILGALTIKRPKKKIKDKLLELGLANDRKELRKKRRKNQDHVKSSWETQSVSGQSDDNTDDDSEDDTSSKKSRMPAVPTKKKAKIKLKKQRSVVYSDSQLSGLLKDVIDKNMRESLEWIKESLEEAIEDRDEESTEGIALVPLTDQTSASMDSPSFQRFLRAVGIEPPADEQEAYWRIPASMLAATIKKRCHLIDDALSGIFLPQDEPQPRNNADSDMEATATDDDDDRVNSVPKMFKSEASFGESRRNKSVSSDSEEDYFEKLERERSEASEIANKTDDNPVESVPGSLESESVGLHEESTKKKSFESDSEEDVGEASKRSRSQDSGTEMPIKKKRRIIISDDEDD